VYRSTTPATPAPKIQPAGRCGAAEANTGRLAVELVLLNKHQISGGKTYLYCYPMSNLAMVSFCAGVAYISWSVLLSIREDRK